MPELITHINHVVINLFPRFRVRSVKFVDAWIVPSRWPWRSSIASKEKVPAGARIGQARPGTRCSRFGLTREFGAAVPGRKSASKSAQGWRWVPQRDGAPYRQFGRSGRSACGRFEHCGSGVEIQSQAGVRGSRTGKRKAATEVAAFSCSLSR